MSSYEDILKNNRVLFEAQKNIIDICKPLFDYLGIGYFHFRRTYDDGSYFFLATDCDWPLYFIKKNIPIKTPVPQEYFGSKSYFCLSCSMA